MGVLPKWRPLQENRHSYILQIKNGPLLVLNGFTLRSEAKIVRHPDRYMDEAGKEMWDTVMSLLPEEDDEGPLLAAALASAT